MAKYAENTAVSSGESRNEIERTLVRFGASQFIYGWKDEAAVIGFTMNGRHREITHTPARGQLRTKEQQEKAYEQEVRQRWRALAVTIKAKFAACEAGISVFEREFFYDTVLPNGQTVGEYMMPQIEQSYQTAKMPPMLPALEWGAEK